MSIDFDAARAAFETFITSDLTGCPTTYENAPDSAAVRAAKDVHTDWCRVIVKTATGIAVDVGPNKRIRFPGLVMITLFGQLDVGTKILRDRATVISDAIQANVFTGMQIRPPEFATGGDKEDDWNTASLNIPFHLDQIS